MLNRLLNWKLIFLFLFVLLAPFVWQILVFLFETDYIESPAHFSAYPQSGYYDIDSENILDRLDRGEIDVFTPVSSEEWDRDEPYYDSIAWTQVDYLNIANALSLQTWNEPLDLKSWKVIDLDFEAGCEDIPQGFHTFSIVYYQALAVENWERQYTSRLIEIYPWMGLVRWGNGAVFSTPLLLGWDGFDLSRFEISADDVLQIAENKGGSEARHKVNNDCMVYLGVNQLSPLPHRVNWLADYFLADFYVHVDPFSSWHKIFKIGQ